MYRQVHVHHKHISVARKTLIFEYFSAKLCETLFEINKLNLFLVVTGKFIEQLIIKISKGKYRYFKCNFNEKTNYAHSVEGKHVLL